MTIMNRNNRQFTREGRLVLKALAHPFPLLINRDSSGVYAVTVNGGGTFEVDNPKSITLRCNEGFFDVDIVEHGHVIEGAHGQGSSTGAANTDD